jgi:folate-dependent phosphoribosylglycinamide formyltransferase PurN
MMQTMSLKVAVLASHTGSNLRALTTAADQPDSAFTIALVIRATTAPPAPWPMHASVTSAWSSPPAT